MFLTSTFNFKLKEISNHFVDGWYDAFEEGVKGCNGRVLCILVRKVNRDVYIQLAVLHFYGTF